MIILDAITKTLNIVSPDVQLLKISAGWTDDATTPTVSVQRTWVSGTEVTVVPAPGAAVSRAVKRLEISNSSLSKATMVTINKVVSGTPTQLYKTELFPGETLKFSSRRGWFKLDNTGVILELTLEPDYEIIIDETSTPGYVYTLKGLPGSDPAEPVWSANRFDITLGKKVWSGRTNQMKHIANNRAALTYP